MSSAAIEQKHAQALCGSEKGRAYAGDDHEAEHPALRHDERAGIRDFALVAGELKRHLVGAFHGLPSARLVAG